MPTPTSEKLEFFYPLKTLTGDGQSPTVHNEDVGGDDQNLVSSTLTQADDFWNGAIGKWVTGALAGEYFHVKDFDAASDTLILARPLSAAPALNDDFILFFGGNWRSDEQVPSMDVSGITNITGLSNVIAGFENLEGNGTLDFTFTGTLCTWAAPGDTAGTAVDIGSNGTFTLFSNDEDQWITFTVVAASLPGSDQSDTVALVNPEAEVLPNWEGFETAAAPKTRYHLIVINNGDGSSQMLDLRVYVLPAGGPFVATTASETLAITEDDFLVADASGYPVKSFWIVNTTKDDIRFVKRRSGNRLFCADATGGLRGKTAQSWDISDAIDVYPEFDIGLDAPSTLQFENPADEETAPSGVVFSAPDNFTDGLVIGNTMPGITHGIWVREQLLASVLARSLFTNLVKLEWS